MSVSTNSQITGVCNISTNSSNGTISAFGNSLSLTNAGIKNTIALLGDSIVLRNLPGPTSGYNVYGADGFFTVGNALLSWAFEIAGVSGNSGQTSTFILGRVTPDILTINPLPRYCFVLAGTNDTISGISVATSISNLKAIYALLQGSGITPIIATIPPRNDVTTAAQKRSIVQLNRWIREYARINDVICCDFYRALVNPASNGTSGYALTTNGALSNTSDDQIHPNVAGALLMGNEVYNRCKNRINTTTKGNGPRDSDCMWVPATGALVEGNIIPNGTFSGVTAGGIGVATGILGEEWSSGGVAGTLPTGGGTIVLSKVAKTDTIGFWQQINISGGSAGDNQGAYAIRTDQDYPSFFGQLGPNTWQTGDTVWGQVSFETDAAGWSGTLGDTNCLIAMRVQFLNATGTTTDTGWGLNGAAISKYRMASGVLRTPNIVVPPNTGAIYMWLYFVGRGVVRWGDPEVRKVIPV